MLILSFTWLKLGHFGNSNVYGRRKYANFCELPLNIYEMKIHLELKFYRKLLPKNFKKVIPEAFHAHFFVENRYNLVHGHYIKPPLLKV